MIPMYVYYYRTYEKAVSGGGERGKGGHVLRDTTFLLVFGGFAFLPSSLGPAGDCPCRH